MNISSKDKKILQDLINKHEFAGKIVGDVADSWKNYIYGNIFACTTIIDGQYVLITFYPVHIQKEDEDFSRDIEEYLTAADADQMPDEF